MAFSCTGPFRRPGIRHVAAARASAVPAGVCSSPAAPDNTRAHTGSAPGLPGAGTVCRVVDIRLANQQECAVTGTDRTRASAAEGRHYAATPSSLLGGVVTCGSFVPQQQYGMGHGAGEWTVSYPQSRIASSNTERPWRPVVAFRDPASPSIASERSAFAPMRRMMPSSTVRAIV